MQASIDFFQQLGFSFLNPQKRLFIGYLVTALLLACVWLFYAKGYRVKRIIRMLASKRVWLSPSAKLDYKIVLFNQLFIVLLSPLLIGKVALTTTIFYILYEVLPSRPSIFDSWNAWQVSLLFTTTYFLLDDFAKYWVHRALHTIPALWAFHKVHHSAEVLTPITVLRTHPVEVIIFSLRSIVIQSILIAVFIFFMGDRVTLVSVLGANVFLFIFNSLGSNLRHSHIPIYYPDYIEKWLISPAQHQIHHSIDKKHYDKNFGVTLAVWDRLFGSLFYSDKRNLWLRFGVNSTVKHTLLGVYLLPFIDSFKAVNKIVKNCSTKLVRRT